MTREDLELLDTPSLRALAREHLPRRAKSLRTRAALLAALGEAPLPRVAAAVAPKPGRRPAPAPDVASAKPAAAKPAAPKSVSATSTLHPTGKAAAAGAQPPTSTAPAPHVAPPVVLAHPGVPVALGPPEDILVEEGFFVVHAQKRRRMRRPAPKLSPRRPASPVRAVRPPPVGEEVPHLLARDPTTLFLFWDFSKDLERGAAFGLDSPRVLFRLYDGAVLVRTVEAPLGRRSLYLEGLEPGHTYRVEAWLVGSDGHARPTGRRSAPLRLAPAVPSGQLEVQMVRVPWEQPLVPRAGAAAAAPAAGQQAPVAAPGRVELPASLDWRGGPGPGGPRSGRP